MLPACQRAAARRQQPADPATTYEPQMFAFGGCGANFFGLKGVEGVDARCNYGETLGAFMLSLGSPG